MRHLLLILSFTQPLLASMGCSRSVTTHHADEAKRGGLAGVEVTDEHFLPMTFRVIDAATGEPLREVTARHERFQFVDQWTSATAVTTLRPRPPDARIATSMEPDFDHYVWFACDGYHQVRVHVGSWIETEEPRIFVEPVVFDPRQPYYTPHSEIILIGLSKR